MFLYVVKDPARYEHILLTIKSLNDLLKSHAINADTRKHTEEVKKSLEREREEMESGHAI